MTTHSVHLGQTPMDFDFAMFQTNIEKTLMSVYAEFANLVFREYGLLLVWGTWVATYIYMFFSGGQVEARSEHNEGGGGQ